MHIFITNDDGVNASGIRDLVSYMPKDWRITIIAPDRERSAHSHSLTLRKPLCLRKLPSHSENIQWFSFSGTPTDCAKFALDFYLKEDMPDLLISGINLGYNLGSDILYSGTVSAAMEGLFYHTPSLALSACEYSSERGHEIIPFVIEMIRKIFIENKFSGLLNVNFPSRGPCDWAHTRVVSQGLQRYMDVVTDSDIICQEGEEYYEIKGSLIFEKEDIPTDVGSVDEGYIPITPLCWQQIDQKSLEEVSLIVDQIKNKED